MNIRLLLFYLMLCFSQIVFSQTGTFDFSIGTTQDGKSATQTISGITLTVFSDNSTEPAPSITLQNWSAYPPFDDDVVTMNGMAKPSCTFNFSGTVNIASLLIADHFGTTNYHLLFTANTTDTYDVTIDGANGTVVTPNFIGITSFVITNYDGGNICVGCDNVVMDESLPVGLTSFTARTAGQAIILKWITESETDNLGFILERAAGNGEWQPLASYKTDAALKGQGNASTTTSYSFIDNTITTGTEYRYRLGDVNTAGIVTMHSPISVTTTALPQSTAMLNAYPNPFNPETTVKYTLHQDAQVTITVYDLLGRKVKTLIDEQQVAGAYHVVWSGTDAVGAKAASGAYLVRMQTAEVTQTQKVLLLK